MSKCQASYFKKRNWGRSESVKGLSSKSQASHEVVVENCNAHSFMSSNAMRQDVFDKRCVCQKVVLVFQVNVMIPCLVVRVL